MEAMITTTIWQEAANGVRLHLELEIASYRHYDQFMEALRHYVNKLVNEDFTKLVRILYRMDISENKLRNLLADHPDADASVIISEMMMEREIKKVETRQQYKTSGDSEEEKW